MRWLTWSFIPGLHWIAWLHAGVLTKHPPYYGLGMAYALPTLLLFLTRSSFFLWRFVLFSWLLGIVHTQLLQSRIQQRIAAITAVADPDPLMQVLLRAALKHGGCLSVTQGVMETGASFATVEEQLQEMVQAGYIYTRNNPDSGILEYVFKEML